MAGLTSGSVEIGEIIDRAPLGPLQYRTFVLCFICMIMDGFDIQALGYSAPSIIREWGLPNAALGPVFAAGNVGVLLGSLCFSMVADRFGRRPVLIAATVFFAVVTGLTGRVDSVSQLLWMRFLAGLGLGAIAPNASSLVAEFSNLRTRPAAIMIVGVGLTIGGVIGGFIAAAVIPEFGWRAVFYLGGVIPILVALAMVWWLPESLQLMVLRKMNPARLLRWANQVDSSLRATASTPFTVTDRGRGGTSLVELFQDGRGLATILFWIVNFMNLLNLYSISSWLPTVARDAGYGPATAVLVGTTLQVGGAIGTFGLAWLVARGGFVRVLAVTFGIAAVSIAAIGQPRLSLPILLVAVFVAGWGIVGSQPGLNSLSGNYYPTHIRSTGVGAGLGVGRIGAIVGPLIGGQLMAAHWSAERMFLAAAGPAVISTLTMVALAGVVGSKLGARSRS